MDPPAASPDAFSGVDDRDAIETAFASLSADHRIVLVLRYYLDLTVDAIAERTGAPAGTVKSRIHHALRELGAALAASGSRETYE